MRACAPVSVQSCRAAHVRTHGLVWCGVRVVSYVCLCARSSLDRYDRVAQVEAGAEAMDLPRTSLARALLVASYYASMLLLLGLIIGHGSRAKDCWPPRLPHVAACYGLRRYI